MNQDNLIDKIKNEYVVHRVTTIKQIDGTKLYNLVVQTKPLYSKQQLRLFTNEELQKMER